MSFMLHFVYWLLLNWSQYVPPSSSLPLFEFLTNILNKISIYINRRYIVFKDQVNGSSVGTPVLKYTVDDDRNPLTIKNIDSFIFIGFGGKKYSPGQVTQLIYNNFSKPPSLSSSKGGMYALIVILKFGANVVSAMEAMDVKKCI